MKEREYRLWNALTKDIFWIVFRMRWASAGSNWYTARVTQIPSFSEKVHMLTIQNIQGNVSQWLEMVVREHPELL